MATAHLIHGYLGAGKTTFAKQLESQIAAVRFSPDEWVTALFGNDPPAEQFDEIYQRVQALVDLQWQRAFACGIDVILDFGFWRREWRDKTRDTICAMGGTCRLYSVSCSTETMRTRCLARNQNLHGSFHISDNTFDSLQQRFEPLKKDEPHIVVSSEDLEK